MSRGAGGVGAASVADVGGEAGTDGLVGGLEAGVVDVHGGEAGVHGGGAGIEPALDVLAVTLGEGHGLGRIGGLAAVQGGGEVLVQLVGLGLDGLPLGLGVLGGAAGALLVCVRLAPAGLDLGLVLLGIFAEDLEHFLGGSWLRHGIS